MNSATWRGIIHGYKYEGKRCFEVFYQEHFVDGFITGNEMRHYDWFHEESSNGGMIEDYLLSGLFEKNTDEEFFAEVIAKVSVTYFRCGEYGEEWDADYDYADEQIRY